MKRITISVTTLVFCGVAFLSFCEKAWSVSPQMVSKLRQQLEQEGCKFVNYESSEEGMIIIVEFPIKKSIRDICNFVPLLRENFKKAVSRISQFNNLSPNYRRENQNVGPEIIKIPADAAEPPSPERKNPRRRIVDMAKG